MNKNFIKKIAVTSFTAISILNFIVAGAIFYYYGINKRMLFGKLPLPYRDWADTFFREIKDLPYFFYSISNANLPVYDLTVDEKDIKKMNDILPTSDQDLFDEENQKYVKAIFKYDGKEYDVKVRYRGDSSYHWFYEKKSWRVVFLEPTAFEGANMTNLIVPFSLLEPFNNYRAKKLGIETLEDKYVVLKINGENYGVYYQVNQYGKDFVERNNLTGDADFFNELFINEKDIFTDSAYWRKRLSDPNQTIDDYASIERLTDLVTRADAQTFHRDIFNIVDRESFINWYVHSLLIGGFHEDWRHNMNLYFDNTVGKFKFFTWQTESSDLPAAGSPYLFFNPLVTRVLESPDFVAAINQRAWDYVSDENNLKDDLKYLDSLYKKTRVAFYKDDKKNFPNADFDKRYEQYGVLINKNFKFIKNYFKQSEAFVKAYVNFPQRKSNELLRMDALINSPANLSIEQMEIVVGGAAADELKNRNVFIYYDSNRNNNFDFGDRALASVKIGKDGRILVGAPDVLLYSNLIAPASQYSAENMKKGFNLETTEHKLFFILDGAFNSFVDRIAVDIKLKNILSEKEVTPRVTYINEDTFKNLEDVNLSADQFLSKYPFFIKDKNGLALPGGIYNFNENIIIPKNIFLRIMPGTEIYFSKGVSLIAYSPIVAKGTKNLPIRFLPTSAGKNWGSVAVIDAGEKSEFDNIIVSGGSCGRVNGAYFSGALSVYGSDASITNSSFSFSACDDGVNVKNANVDIVNNYFYKNSADGIDGDFIEGNIKNNLFIKNGNDGIDVSGSTVLIRDNLFKSNGDKGISIGEQSYATIFNNAVAECVIGVAVKDLSEVNIVNNVFYNNKTGVVAYQKKDIFGGGKINIVNSIIWGGDVRVERDDLSEVNITYSDVEGGFSGDNNKNIKPEFLNEQKDNYILSKNSQVLSEGGNAEIYKELVGDRALVPMGLIK